jgi:hypothetical protein
MHLRDQLLKRGIIDEEEVEVICREIYADGKIDNKDMEFLVVLRDEAQSVCPAFERLFFQALKHHVLADGLINKEKAGMLRRLLSTNGKIGFRERRFLWDLQAQANQVSAEFLQLYEECVDAAAAEA